MTQATATRTATLGDSGLVELLDRLIETGVTATGDVLLGLADVDLIRVSLRVALGSVDTLSPDRDQPESVAPSTTPVNPAPAAINDSHSRPHASSSVATRSRAADRPDLALPIPDHRSDLGIGGLLVAVIQIVHGLLERQAIHRMENGTLTDDQIERLGQALMDLDGRIRQLIELFSARPTPELPVAITDAL